DADRGRLLGLVGSGWEGIFPAGGGWATLAAAGVLVLKIQLVCAAFILVRAALPRHRFDQLIQLCWKYLFPLVLGLVVVVVGVQYSALLWSLASDPAAPAIPSAPTASLWTLPLLVGL